MYPKCDVNVRIMSNGKCGDKCEVFKRLSDDQLKCETPKCRPNEMISKSGLCQECPKFMISVGNGIDCQIPNCNLDAGEVINQKGECLPAPTKCSPKVIIKTVPAKEPILTPIPTPVSSSCPVCPDKSEKECPPPPKCPTISNNPEESTKLKSETGGLLASSEE